MLSQPVVRSKGIVFRAFTEAFDFHKSFTTLIENANWGNFDLALAQVRGAHAGAGVLAATRSYISKRTRGAYQMSASTLQKKHTQRLVDSSRKSRFSSILSGLGEIIRDVFSAPFELLDRLTYRPNARLEKRVMEVKTARKEKDLVQFHIDNCTEQFYTGRTTGSHTVPIIQHDPDPDESMSPSQQAQRNTLKRSYQNMDPAKRSSDQTRSLVIRPHKGVLGQPHDKGTTTGSYDRIPAVSRWNDPPKPKEKEAQQANQSVTTSGVHAAIYRAMNTDTMNPHGLKQFISDQE